MPPFRFVVAHQHLIVQPIDLDRHRAEIGRKMEHAGQRLVVQESQSRPARASAPRTARAAPARSPTRRTTAPPHDTAERRTPPLRSSARCTNTIAAQTAAKCIAPPRSHPAPAPRATAGRTASCTVCPARMCSDRENRRSPRRTAFVPRAAPIEPDHRVFVHHRHAADRQTHGRSIRPAAENGSESRVMSGSRSTSVTCSTDGCLRISRTASPSPPPSTSTCRGSPGQRHAPDAPALRDSDIRRPS